MTKMKKQNKYVERLNQWVNALTAQGNIWDKTAAGYFSSEINLIEDVELEALYHENDFARTIVERVVVDSFYKKPKAKIMSNSSEQSELDSSSYISEGLLKKWNVNELTKQASIWGRLYGCGGLILGVDDGDDITKPLQFPIAQGSLKWIETFDKQNLTPVSYYAESDSGEPDWESSKIGKPKIYSLTKNSYGSGSNKHFHIHVSRLIFFPGVKTSNRVKSLNRGCDLSVLHDKYEVLRDVAQSWNSAQKLIQDASIAVYKLRDLDLQISKNRDLILKRTRMVDYAKSTARSIIIDAEMEDYQHVGAQNLTGVEPIVEQAFKRLAASARMPLTILMGQSPAGLNATGESDRDQWYKQIQVFQEDVLKDRMQILLNVIAQNEGLITEGQWVEVEFPSLWEESDIEKVQKLQAKADLAEKLIGLGIKTTDEVKEWFE